MKDKVLRFIRENALISPGSTLVCAVSGGKDSVCLLHVMLSLQKELSIKIEAAHLNHQLRGEESSRDEAFVRALCRTLGVQLTVSRADVLSRCEAAGESTEEAARILRYQFFDSLHMPVATAHTQDDNLETVLLNLVRGTALRGLCGIPPKRGAVIRPLLAVSREEVERYLLQNSLPHMEDSTNAEDAALRNRLRHHVIPLLKQENPKLGETVCAMDEILRREDAYLEEAASLLLSKSALSANRWSCPVLNAAPPAICARAVRLLLGKLAVPKPSRAHVQAVLKLLSSTGGSQSVTLPGGRILLRSYDVLEAQTPEGAPQSFAAKKLLPGESVAIPELSLTVSCRVVKKYEKSMLLPCTFAFKYDTIEKIETLCVRPRQTGDEILLPGGHKTLKKLFIDRKIPSHRRSLVPVVADSRGVLLVYPFAASAERGAQPGEAAILIQFVHEKEYIQKEDTR